MRKLALAVLMVSAVAGGFVGCGGSSARKTTGKAGADGGTAGGTAGATAGSGGAAGSATGVGGDTGGAGGAAGATAGAGGAAGDTGGAGGMAGGAAGATAGAGGTPPPVLTYCEMHPEQVRALPYTIAKDFKVVHVLSNNNSAGYWKVVGTPDCSDNPTYPPFPSDGGVDGSDDATEAGTEAGVDGSDDAASDAGTEAGADGGATDSGDETLQLDPDAGDGGVADAALDVPVDAPAADVPASDGSTTDGGTDVAVNNDGGADAGPPLPACYEFSYDPDGCVGACWAGAVFEVTDVQGPSADTKGVCIQTGAMAVEFWARASKNNARVKFGSIGEGTGLTEFYLNITTTWTRYTVAVPNEDYNITSGDMHGVWNAFSVVVEQGDHAGGTYIEVKDIHWIATP